jgi:hypothetical protein
VHGQLRPPVSVDENIRLPEPLPGGAVFRQQALEARAAEAEQEESPMAQEDDMGGDDAAAVEARKASALQGKPFAPRSNRSGWSSV